MPVLSVSINKTRRVALRSDFQLFRKSRQLPAGVFRHDHDIFLTGSADAGVIKARFDRQDLSIFQRYFLQTRVLVNFEPESVTSAMKEADLPAVAHFRAITAFREEILDRFVNSSAIDPGLNFFQGESLPRLDRFPKLSLRLARPSAHNRARHVAEVARLGIARENIEND